MFKITGDNYEEYKKVFEIIWRTIHKVTASHINVNPEYSPIVVLSSWEKKNMSLAKRGLKEGLRDLLTMKHVTGAPPAIINKINNQLIKHKLPTLNKLIATIKYIPGKVLKRGRINNLDEYYIIKEIICDVDYDIANEDRMQLEKLLFEFEFKKDNNKKAK